MNEYADELIHHNNHDPYDNELENLVIFKANAQELNAMRDTHTIDIEMYQGYPIILDTVTGMFRTDIDESIEEHASLLELREALDRVTAKVAQRTREAITPAHVYLLTWKHNFPTLETVTVTGVVAHRYHRTIKTNKGQREPNQRGRDRFISLRDSRIPELELALHDYTQAQVIAERHDKAVSQLLNEFVQVAIPDAKNKEEALEKEPDFLEALRTLPAP